MASTSLLHQPRRHLDGKRLIALLIDAAVFAPLVMFAQGYDVGAQLTVLALFLAYDHLCTVTTGQTIGKAVMGLRVVTVDGHIVDPWKGSARTVLRLIEENIIGLLIYVLSGERRQRLGDLAARTIVVRASEVDPPQPRLAAPFLAYPALWLAPALAIVALNGQGKYSLYHAEVSSICEQIGEEVKRNPRAAVHTLRVGITALDVVDVPRDWRPRHDALVHEATEQTNLLASVLLQSSRSAKPARAFARGAEEMAPAIKASNAHIRELGYAACGKDGPA